MHLLTVSIGKMFQVFSILLQNDSLLALSRLAKFHRGEAAGDSDV